MISALFHPCCFTGASPNLHFHTLPGTQIYTTHIYTKPTVTQHQIYTGPKFTRTPIFTTSNLHNPILHKPKYTQPQNSTKPNFTQTKFTQVPILHNQGTRYFPSLFLAVQTFYNWEVLKSLKQVRKAGLCSIRTCLWLDICLASSAVFVKSLGFLDAWTSDIFSWISGCMDLG